MSDAEVGNEGKVDRSSRVAVLAVGAGFRES